MDINLVFMSKIFIFTSSVDNLLSLIVKILERGRRFIRYYVTQFEELASVVKF
jgi:hypothetical protein